MGNSLRIEFPDLKAFQDNIAKYGAAVKKDVGTAVLDALSNIAKEAKLNIQRNKSVVTGSMERGNNLVYDDATCSGVVFNDIVYAPYVEYGTHHAAKSSTSTKKTHKAYFIPAKPFFGPAVDETIPQFKDELKAALKA